MKLLKRTALVFTALLVIMAMASTAGYCQTKKIAYVDLRQAFYDYDKTQEIKEKVDDLTEKRQSKRDAMVEDVTRLRQEADLLKGPAKQQKQAAIDQKLEQLREYDRKTREELLNQRNEMFRVVINDIQDVVQKIGEKEGYDYVLDSRNIMYAKEKFDITEKVLEKLNQK